MINTLLSMRETLQAYVPGFPAGAYNSAINRAYDDISKAYPWTRLEREFKFVTKQYIANGGVHFTNGAATITAAGSVSAAWASSAGGTNLDLAGMFIKKNVNDEAAYYVITSNDSVEITVTESYLGKTTTAVVSAGNGYFIFQHLYNVPSGIETVTHLMARHYLTEADRYALELRNADLDWSGEPSSWANYGVNSANQCVVQLYPPKLDDIYELRGWGRLKIEQLTDADSPLLDSNMIIAYAEVELMKRKRMLNPDSVSDDMLSNAMGNAEKKMTLAIELDSRQRSPARYTHDKMFRSAHPGQKWLVSHDPWQWGWRSTF